LTIGGVTQVGVFAASPAPTLAATGETFLADGPVADDAGGEFVSTSFTVDALAVHAGQGQIVGAGEVIVGAQEQSGERPEAHFAGQGFDGMTHRIPNDGAGHGRLPILDPHGEREFGLGDDRKVDEVEFGAQTIFGLGVGELGGVVGAGGGEFAFEAGSPGAALFGRVVFVAFEAVLEVAFEIGII
jgi:hypothetical protein